MMVKSSLDKRNPGGNYGPDENIADYGSMRAGTAGLCLETPGGMAAESPAAGSAGGSGNLFYQSCSGIPGISGAGGCESRYGFDMLSAGISWPCGTLWTSGFSTLVEFSQK